MKIFVSMPMTGKTKAEIFKTFNRVSDWLKTGLGDDIEVVHGYSGKNASPIWLLGNAIQKMDGADAVCFARGWQWSDGCRVEHEVANRYDTKIIYEPIYE